jgi:hypothetical protein
VPDSFKFSIEYTDQNANLRYYYPDFLVVESDGVHWIVETKGAETVEVAHKDRAARLWCENATDPPAPIGSISKSRRRASTTCSPRRLATLYFCESGAPPLRRGEGR